MRKAIHKSYKQSAEGKWDYIWETAPLPFHGFFTAGTGEHNDSFEIGPVALLEKPDGSIFEVDASHIKFVVEDSPKPPEVQNCNPGH